MAAPVGNTNGARGKQWRDALRKALMQFETGDVMRGEALSVIAQKVISGALNGDMDCIQELANRLDGKPAQGITIGGDEDSPLQHKHEIIFIRGTDRVT